MVLKGFHTTSSCQYVFHFLLLKQNTGFLCFAINFEAYPQVYFDLLLLFDALTESSYCTKSCQHCP